MDKDHSKALVYGGEVLTLLKIAGKTPTVRHGIGHDWAFLVQAIDNDFVE
jgi:hypothetical protein